MAAGQLQRNGSQQMSRICPMLLNLEGKVCLLSGVMNRYKLK